MFIELARLIDGHQPCLFEIGYSAANEGRQIQALVDEALRDYIECKTGNPPRGHVMDAFRNSMARYDSLYKALAK